MAVPIIRTNNIAVVYGEGSAKLRALDGVNIEIFPEEYIIFFGPSGCGKSTLLYTIAGLERTTEGSVIVSGKEISKLSREEMVDFHRNTIGMIFQAYYLISSLSVLQNVALPQIFASKSPEDRESKANALLKRFGILEQADKIPTELSGGQQQRVAIARSLANNAPIILADEPVGNLDSKSADTVLELLKDLNKTDKKTVIMVTHNPNHLHYADRVFYMKDGKVIREVRNENEKEKPPIKIDEQIPLMNFGLQEYAKLFPHLSEEELKAKMLTSYILGEIDIETEEKLEKLVGDYMRHQINDEQFIRRVTKPVKSDGLGLYHAFAERLVSSLKTVLSMADFLVQEYGAYPKTYEVYDNILTKLATYLYQVTEHKPTPEDMERVKKVLKSRLEGSVDHIGFQEFLDKPVKEGGAGLNVRTARNFARQFELILLGFDEHVRKNAQNKPIDKPHLFGLKPHANAPATTGSPGVGSTILPTPPQPQTTQQQQSSNKTPAQILPKPPVAPSPEPKIAPNTTLSAPVSKNAPTKTPNTAYEPQKPLILQQTRAENTAPNTPTPAPKEKSEVIAPKETITSQPKTVEDTIQFFSPEAPSQQNSTPSVASSFLSTLTHALHHEKNASQESAPEAAKPASPPIHQSEKQSTHIPAPLYPLPPRKIVFAPKPITSSSHAIPSVPPSSAVNVAKVNAHDSVNDSLQQPAPEASPLPSAPKPPVAVQAPANALATLTVPTPSQSSPTPPIERAVPHIDGNTPLSSLSLSSVLPPPPPPPQFNATKPTPYNPPMIFPQKLQSFTQEKHENR